MKNCVVLCSMPIGPEEAALIKTEYADAFVICVDAGYLTARQYGIPCHLLMGDFDSMPFERFEQDVPCKRFQAEKDYTDSLIALMEGLSRGYREFAVFGALGGRQDHNLGNIYNLGYLLDNGARGTLVDQNTRIFTLDKETCTLPYRENCYFSVFPFGQPEVTVSLRGVKYPLHDYKLQAFVPIGVSNEFKEETAEIQTDGRLLVMIVGK